ncbi:MAG: hemolysin family protein [Clostridiales bacterium]|nr:hemolysin family protein [Clostridiales bacterium]
MSSIVLLIILIFLNAVFASAEIAVISVNDARLAKLEDDGDKRAAKLKKLTDEPAKFLATIQVAITFSGFLASAFAADNFAERLAGRLVEAGVTALSEKTLETIAVVVITLLLSYFTLVFGEFVPKRIAMKQSEKLALIMAGPVTVMSKLFAPAVWILTISTNAVLRLMGIDPNAEIEEVSEEEIRLMVDEGGQKGVIDADEQEMINNVFEFDDLIVDEFATHRTDISLLWLDEPLEEWEKTIHESRHSRYPVCDETVDKIIGVLDVKDFFRLDSDRATKDVILKEAVRPAYFVPESVHADVLFRQMKKTHNYFAVVLDEYGGMTGIVTMNDLLEQIVGDLDEEPSPEEEEPEIERIDSSTWKIQGGADLEEVAETLDIDLPVDEYDTFGGYIFGNYGTIPDDGMKFEISLPPLQIRVTEIKDHRIKKAIVCFDKE